MAEEFSQNILLKVVAQICQMVGFDRIMTSPLHILVDILREFICNLGQVAQHYAEHCGRSSVNLNDLSLSFFDCGIKPAELSEFLRIVSPLPQSIPVPKYPVKKSNLYLPPEKSEDLPKIGFNHEEPRETLKIKISLSKIKSAISSKRVKSTKNKNKKKKKSHRAEKTDF